MGSGSLLPPVPMGRPHARVYSLGLGGGAKIPNSQGREPLADLFAGMPTTAGAQTKALSPYTSNVQTNPMHGEAFNLAKGAYGGLESFASSLADKSNQNITLAMQRGRDALAGSLADVRSGAGMRGAIPGSGLSNLLQTRAAMQGQRGLQALNADLTEKALGQELQARRGLVDASAAVTGAAGGASLDQRERERLGADIWKFGNQFELEKTKTDLGQMNFLLENVLKYLNPFSGAGGGGMPSGGLGGGMAPPSTRGRTYSLGA